MALLQRLLRVGMALLALVLSDVAFGQITPQTPVTTRNPRFLPQSKILFTANRDLYVINPDGTGLLNLTKDDLFDLYPVWSPDGSKIAFTTIENGYPYLRVVDVDGKNLRKVYNQHTYTTGSVVWSPNGASLAFTGGMNGYLYRINLDGTGLTQLTDFTVGNIDWGKNNRIVFNKTSPGVINHPKPMFTQSGWMQIFSLDANRPALAERALNGDSSGLAQLTRNGMRKMDPFWSPDASKIAFIHLAAGGVLVSKGDGSQPDSVGDGWHHAWSRDGRKVVYVSSEGGGRLAVSTDGSRGARLTLAGGAGSPTFSPDGQFIAYAITTGSDSGQLMVIPSGGGTPRPLLPANIRVATDNTGSPGYVGHRYVIWSPVVYDPTIQRLQTIPPAVSGARAQPLDSAPAPPPAAPSGKPTNEPEAAAHSTRILLVDDDWSDNNADPAKTQLSPSDKLFRGLLDKGWQGKPLPYDVSVVPNDKDGPGIEVLQKYDLVLWYNGSSYGGNPDADSPFARLSEQYSRIRSLREEC